MSTLTSLAASTTTRITPATDVLSAWGTSAATGPIIVQGATWAMAPSATGQLRDTDGDDSDGDRTAPTRAA